MWLLEFGKLDCNPGEGGWGWFWLIVVELLFEVLKDEEFDEEEGDKEGFLNPNKPVLPLFIIEVDLVNVGWFELVLVLVPELEAKEEGGGSRDNASNKESGRAGSGIGIVFFDLFDGVGDGFSSAEVDNWRVEFEVVRGNIVGFEFNISSWLDSSFIPTLRTLLHLFRARIVKEGNYWGKKEFDGKDFLVQKLKGWCVFVVIYLLLFLFESWLFRDKSAAEGWKTQWEVDEMGEHWL